LNAERIMQLGEGAGHAIPTQVVSSARGISNSAKRIAGIVQGLLTFAKDAGGDPLERAEVGDLGRRCLDLCKQQLIERGIELRGDIEGSSIAVRCRPSQVVQILLHLVSNARDAVLRESGEKWIRLQAEVRDGWVELGVTDSGSGVPVEYREKLFQPFFTTKDIGQGTGLGLSIAKGLAESQGGLVALDPDFSATRFVVRLPQA
jgi:signal transduction histidine kinase